MANKRESIRDGSALLAEFLKSKAALRRLVARIVKPHDVDDILQETFIRAAAAAERTPIRHPRSFMQQTAQNLALNHAPAPTVGRLCWRISATRLSVLPSPSSGLGS